ncbi:Spastin [Trema orientale]|uniref:Spastin n=1 Tax=Trema orientale TaxID=63057 RepID=A0A2P5ARR3_TREOI|nr:Spastin [Trema orientale]
MTLSGLLNFIDGLWSCFGEGRIIVFTTNYKERLDPALLRPGRMDMHIFMSFCNPCVFKQLACTYLGVRHHNLFGQIEKLIEEVEVTPAEVAGELMKTTDAEISLPSLFNFLHNKQAK